MFEEEHEGNLAMSVIATITSANDDSDNTGIEVVQDDEGTGKLTLTASDIADGVDTDGVSMQ